MSGKTTVNRRSYQRPTIETHQTIIFVKDSTSIPRLLESPKVDLANILPKNVKSFSLNSKLIVICTFYCEMGYNKTWVYKEVERDQQTRNIQRHAAQPRT